MSGTSQPVALQGFPLSPQQRRLWGLGAGEPGAPYGAVCTVRVDGELDPRRLRQTLERVAERHEALRTTFRCLPGMSFPLQVVGEGGLDWQDDPGGLDNEGPLRASLIAEGPCQHLLRLSLPALCADRRSLANLVGEIARAYAEAHDGDEGRPMQYADVAAWQDELLDSEETAAERDFWRGLEVAPLLAAALPFEHAAAAGFTPRALAGFDLGGGVAGISAEAFLLACWQILIGRLSGRDELVVSVRSEGRDFAELEEVVGPLEKLLPVVCRWDEGERFAQVARRAGRAVEQARAHQNAFAWERLARWNDAPEEALGPSLAFAMDEGPCHAESGGLRWSLGEADAVTDRFALQLVGAVAPDRSLRGVLRFDASRFQEEDVRRMAGWLQVLARQAAAAPETASGELEMLPPEERQRELEERNLTRVELPRRLLHELVREQAARTPEKVAVRSGSNTLTFARLLDQAGRLARRLRTLGVGPEVPVAVHAERSFEMVVALLGVLEAGGAWVPLDPDHPAERLAGILEDVSPVAVLTQRRLAGTLPRHGGGVVLLDELDERGDAPAEEVGPSGDDRLAYVIYTSGSTGRPKGVMVSHRAIVNRLLWMAREHPLAPDDRVLQKTPYGFDASIWEIFCPLLAGAELVLARPGGHQDSAYLAGAVADQGITVLQLVPSLLRPFLDEPAAAECRSLRRMFCGGEELPAELARRFSSLLPEAALCNLYGPTETAIDATFHVCDEPPAGRSVPIGRPIANLEVYLLSPRGLPVPAGVAGELYIGGAGLARGYWRRPDQTAERFIPHPFSLEPGTRLYRTGDLARRRPDGAIEYLGRADRQIKVRGVRIEPREIEAVLAAHPEVRQAVVLPVPEREGDGMRLAAFVVPEVETADLRRHLGERLPAAMMPAVLVPLRALPLNPNGKLDTRALAGAALTASEAGRESGYAAPRTPVEQVLAEIWAEVLGAERVGIRDGFFDLGGHSLRATQLVSRVRRVFQVELPVRDLFERPTVEALAVHLDRLLAGGESAVAPPVEPILRAMRGEGMPLSFAQQRLWFLEQLRPGTPLYNIPDAVRLRGALDVAALAAALSEVVRRHEALRTAFPTVRGEAMQRIDPPAPVALPVVDLSALPASRRDEEAARRTDDEGGRPFDLSRGPLLRAVLFRLDADEHRAAFTVHHIVSDAWSTGILVRELAAVYRAIRAGEPSPLPELPYQYADFASWQRRWLEGGALESQLAWWRERLAGAPPVLDLPADRPRPERPSYRGATRLVLLPSEVTDELRALGRREGATLFMAVFAAFAVVLRRLTGRDDVVAGTDVANRHRGEVEGLIGFFVNQLVLRLDLSGDPTFLELLARAREAALGAYAHQDVPFETLVDRLQVERSTAWAPLFQVKIFLENTPATSFELPGLAIERLDTAVHTAKLDLTLALWERPEGLSGWLSYATDLFDEPRMVRLVQLLTTAATAAATWPGARLSELDGVFDEFDRRERASRKAALAKAGFQSFQAMARAAGRKESQT